MDILNTLIKENGADLLASLTGSGFSEEQANNFLPEATSSLTSLLGDNAGDMNVESLIGKMDIASLASKIGIDSSLAETGLKQILPLILGKLGGGDLGGLMGKVKSLF